LIPALKRRTKFRPTVRVEDQTFLPKSTLYVERADGPDLLSIKRGEWPLEKVKAESERLFQLAQEAKIRSSLPPEPDRDRAEKLCVKMIAEYHGVNVGYQASG
jgi:hypothetical protein